MILQALHDLWQREWLSENPDFVMEEVGWIVRLATDGTLLGIVGTQSNGIAQSNKATRMSAKPFPIPRPPTGRSGTKAPPCFFVDNAKYVFGLSTKDKSFDASEGREKAAAFRDLIAGCVRETNDDGAKAVLTFLEHVANNETKIVLDERTRSNDLFGFIVAPDIDRLVHERPAIVGFWRQKRAVHQDLCGKVRLCLVTGKPISSAPLFPLIRGVPGKGTSTGVGLVSFNKEAFRSHGWDGNDNASISREAAEACSDALNRLMHDSYRLQSGQTLPRQNVKLSADTVVCFWAKKLSIFESVFAPLFEGNPTEVGELFRSVWRGKLSSLEDRTAFYVLTLSGSQGRAIVRDWLESTVDAVARNLSQHFVDLFIVRNTKPVEGRALPESFPLRVLLESLAPNGKSEDIPAPHVAAVVRAALQGALYPLSLLQRAIERQRAEMSQIVWADKILSDTRADHISRKKARLVGDRRDARAALIKAVLNRRRRSLTVSRYQEVSPIMDPTISSQGYVLGRLLAVIERLQLETMPNVNASVIDRYFSGASASPKSVFVRLLKNSRHHVSKLKGEGTKYGHALRWERLIDDMAERFDPRHNGFPAYLDLEQQGLFILGYHQMRHWLWLPNEERTIWEREHTNAPRAYLWSTGKQSNNNQEEMQ
jgi:CRISPR-associated protein Csd1